MTVKYAKEDPLLVAQQYGTITNPRVKVKQLIKTISPPPTNPFAETNWSPTRSCAVLNYSSYPNEACKLSIRS